MFLLEYMKNPRNVGAIAPSGKVLAHKMIEGINFHKAECIVEYGPGTGVFTEKLLARVKEDTTVILIEINKEFYLGLKELYGHKENVIILNESAENIEEILRNNNINQVDYIISGLPFTSLPEKVSHKILDKTAEVLGEKGEFRTFQYTLFKEGLFKSFFHKINVDRAIVNLPPAYILKCRK